MCCDAPADRAGCRRGHRRHNASMSLVRVLGTLETDRLVLRHSRVGDAAVYRRICRGMSLEAAITDNANISGPFTYRC